MISRLIPVLIGTTLALLVLLSGTPASATVWYVTGTGAGATDGTNYANAFAGWADINMAGINAGDTLIICGTVSSATKMSFTRAGSAGSVITVTGLCPEEGETATGVLDGLNSAAPVFQLSEAGLDASLVNTQDLEIKNSGQAAGNNCVTLSSLGGGSGGNVFSRVVIHHCGGGYGIVFQKASPTLEDSEIYDIGGDAVGWTGAGTNAIIRRNHIYDFSTLNINGDAIACNSTMASGVLIQGNTIRFTTATGVKQGIICGNNGTGTVIIEFNTLTSYGSKIAAHGISIESGSAIVRANHITGFNACVTEFTGTITAFDVIGNVCIDSRYTVLLTTGAGTPTLNVFNNTGINVTNGLRATSNTAAVLVHSNNLYSLTPGAGGDALYVSASHASYAGNNNLYYPEGTTFIENYECGGSTYSTLAAYKAACAQDAQSLASNPLLLTNGKTSGSSPARRAGVAYADCKDLRGRVCWNPPDIGAYQATSGDPAATRAVRN